MNIPRNEWQDASGKLVEDDNGQLWRVIGFIDQPTVILEPVKLQGNPMQQTDTRQRAYEVMGSETSKRFHRLVRKGADDGIA